MHQRPSKLDARGPTDQPERVCSLSIAGPPLNIKEEITDYFEELARARSILSVVNAALEETAFEANPDPNVVSGVAMLIRQLCEDRDQVMDMDDMDQPEKKRPAA